MFNCPACKQPVPFRRLLFSPPGSVSDVVCPHCRKHLTPAPWLRWRIRLGLVLGGLLAGTTYWAAHEVFGWGLTAASALLAAVVLSVSLGLTLYLWWHPDFTLRP